MKLRLTWVEVNRRDEIVTQRDEVIEGESQRTLTKASARRLILQHYPDMRVLMGDSFRPPHKWSAASWQVRPEKWAYVYADPIEGQS
jgi:hypothetical protein